MRRLPNWLAAVENNPPLPVTGGGNRRKRKAKDKEMEQDQEDALSVEDLVTIAHELVKDSEQDSEPTNQSTTLNLTTQPTFSALITTDDPAQDMLNLLLGPFLPNKPQPDHINLQSHNNHFKQENKKTTLKDKLSFLLH
ncbi:hypothetical protein M5689_000011 [Euphorbia peplus]|nr:hypothetical protein M5689_000011 [Euphorbia peplus]